MWIMKGPVREVLIPPEGQADGAYISFCFDIRFSRMLI